MMAVGRTGGQAVGGWLLYAGIGVLMAASPADLQSASPPVRPFASPPVRQSARPPVRPSAQDSAVGRLYAPGAVQERAPTVAGDNDAVVKALEGKLRCTCGCNLDVFTCRTTDFTCATSPAMHRLVLARIDSGMTPDQVIAAFETQYGQSVLMQPPRRGFNWAAYLMPFVGLGAGILILMLVMRRVVRLRPTDAEEAAAAAAASEPAAPGASPEELERLKRELAEFEA